MPTWDDDEDEDPEKSDSKDAAARGSGPEPNTKHDPHDHDGKDGPSKPHGGSGMVLMMTGHDHGHGEQHDGTNLQDLARRLSDLKSRIHGSIPSCSPDTDPRQVGWPCNGTHCLGKEKSNQYSTWVSCKRCGG